MKRIHLLIITLLLANTLLAGNIEDAFQNYRERNFAKALEFYTEAYKKREGMSRGGLAAMWIGSLYEQGGHGVEKDLDEAVKWYKNAIKRDHYFAYGKLGLLYSSSKNSKHYDVKKAVSCAADLIDALPNDYTSHGDAARIYFQVGDVKRAVQLQIMAIDFAEDRRVEKSAGNAKRILLTYQEKLDQLSGKRD